METRPCEARAPFTRTEYTPYHNEHRTVLCPQDAHGSRNQELENRSALIISPSDSLEERAATILDIVGVEVLFPKEKILP